MTDVSDWADTETGADHMRPSSNGLAVGGVSAAERWGAVSHHPNYRYGASRTGLRPRLPNTPDTPLPQPADHRSIGA